MSVWRLVISLAVIVSPFRAQQARPSSPEFDVASVKAVPLGGIGHLPTMKGGPGTDDPERISYSQVTLMSLLTKAFGVLGDQILGPGWLITETYSVDAKVSPGTSKGEFQVMLQNLLVKRFGVALHREERDFAIYSLAVTGGGIKNLNKSIPTEEPDNSGRGEGIAGSSSVVLGGDGCPVVAPGRHAAIGSTGTNNCTTFRRYSMSDLAGFLAMIIAMEDGSYFGSQASQAHVIDKTGLPGEFDFNLKFVFRPRPVSGPRMADPASEPSGADIFTTLEKQVGLRLEKTRAPLTVLVIDHIVKTPTAN